MKPITNIIGGAWSVYQAMEATEQSRRAHDQEMMLLESQEQYNAVASYMRDPQASQVLGAGRLANINDLAAANMFSNDGLYIGAFAGRPIFYNGDRHALSYGRTRSGKGTDVILPILGTNVRESLIVTDIKDGENAYATAAARQASGHKVMAMNPSNIAGIKSYRLNPCQTMIDVARSGYELAGEDQLFIEKFLPMTPKQAQADNAWALEGAREILRIRAKFLAYFRPSKCNPAELWYMVHGSADQIRMQYEEMIACGDESISRPAETYLHVFENIDRQYGAYRTGLNRAVGPYEPNSVFADETGSSDFDPADLKRDRATIYVMLPTDKIEVGAQWLTLMVSTMMERIAAATGTIRTTVVLDEMANLPYMPIIPKALKLFGGKGVRMWGFCQGRHSLLDAGYTQETIREFEDQSGFLQLWEVEDMGLTRDIEGWGGKKGVAVRNATMGGGGGKSAAFSINEVARPVLQAEDIRAIGKGQQLLKVAGCPYLIHAGRVPWYQIPSLRNRLRDPREINTGVADWSPVRRKRVLAIPAPEPSEATSFEPDSDELLAMALAENDDLRDQLANEKDRKAVEFDILDVLRNALSSKKREDE